MPTRKAEAKWNGDLKSGNGVMKVGSGAFEGSYSFSSRFENGEGTNPEELIGAALAGCFSMSLSHELTGAGYEPKSTATNADVHFEKGIKEITLNTQVEVSGVSDDEFQKIAEGARKNCHVSRALTGTTISLNAKMI
ncbi:MAG: OsmC family peroxiredoxin [Balneolales bacterium]